MNSGRLWSLWAKGCAVGKMPLKPNGLHTFSWLVKEHFQGRKSVERPKILRKAEGLFCPFWFRLVRLRHHFQERVNGICDGRTRMLFPECFTSSHAALNRADILGPGPTTIQSTQPRTSSSLGVAASGAKQELHFELARIK